MTDVSFVEQRVALKRPGQLIGREGSIDCEVLSVSRRGAQVRLQGVVEKNPGEFFLSIRDFGQLGCVVADVDDDIVDLRFRGDEETQDSVFQEIVAALGDDEGRRHFLRRSVLWPGTLKSQHGHSDCTILNMSLTGAKVALSVARDCAGNVVLLGDRFEGLPATVVWQRGRLVGLQFRLDPAEVAGILGDLLPAIKASA